MSSCRHRWGPEVPRAHRCGSEATVMSGPLRAGELNLFKLEEGTQRILPSSRPTVSIALYWLESGMAGSEQLKNCGLSRSGGLNGQDCPLQARREARAEVLIKIRACHPVVVHILRGPPDDGDLVGIHPPLLERRRPYLLIQGTCLIGPALHQRDSGVMTATEACPTPTELTG